jgi:hypothetical protein
MLYPEGSTHTIVPAAPGWYVAWPWHEPPRARGVTLDTVIAWLMVHSVGEYHPSVKASRNEKPYHLDCYPITTDGVIENIGETAVLKDPSGQFIRMNDRVYDSKEEFLDDWERRTAEEKTAAVKLVPK